jgi:hypothetical protein
MSERATTTRPGCPAIPPGYGTNPQDCACGACETVYSDERQAAVAEASLRRVSTATAYDYEAQCWVRGPAAERLIRAQARDTLACIDRPSYRRMMGYSDVEAVAIKTRALELAGE